MENMSSELHRTDVLWIRVTTLTIFDRINETVGKLPRGTQEIWLHKVHHGVVCGVSD